MSTVEPERHPQPEAISSPLSDEQLRAYEQGWGVMLMPVTNGWRVRYFSSPDFDAEPGTSFPDLQSAIAAITDLLPMVNSDEQRDQARALLQARMRELEAPE